METQTLAATAALTTRQNPWPLQLLNEKICGYVDKMSPVWIRAQVVSFKSRGGYKLSFLTLRDTQSESFISLTANAAVIDRCPGLKEGAEIVVLAKPTYWTRRGTLQLEAGEIHLSGIGNLLEQLEELRRKLAAEGLFATELKQPLPFLPRRVGLICGRQAKAQDDVIVNARARWPSLEFTVLEVAVQGVNCVKEVCAAINQLDADPSIDVIIVTRGGGAVEELLPFSDETMVRTAAACKTPLVAAIGHETDCPLLDLVADYRASTPTDAARKITPDLREEQAIITQARARLLAGLQSRLLTAGQELAAIRSRPALARPQSLFENHAEALQGLRLRLRAATGSNIEIARAQLQTQWQTLRALSPLATMERGYAVITTAQGEPLLDAKQTEAGAPLTAILARGRLQLTVESTQISHTKTNSTDKETHND